MLLYSDGVVEAHNPDRELYGFPRIRALVGRHDLSDAVVIAGVLDDLEQFTGPGLGAGGRHHPRLDLARRIPSAGATERQAPVGTFEVPSDLGNERVAADRVVDAVAPLDCRARPLDRLRTVVAEATMNAIEHGNECRAEVPVGST